MKVFELLHFFNKQLHDSIINSPKNILYIKNAYYNVSKKIKEISNNKLLTNSDILKLNITEHMKNKLLFLLTKKINQTEHKKLNHTKLINDLINVSGIGRIKAESLIKAGVTKIPDLNKKIYNDQLNNATKLLMKYKPLRKIKYTSIKKIENKLTEFPNSHIVGSFRRKKQYSKDIDIIVISDKKNILDAYLTYLKNKFNEIHVYSKGIDKVSLIILISPKKYFKIDVFKTPIANKYAMLLYSTGPKEFNILMRVVASKMNCLLNQTGLYKLKNKIPNKIPIPVKSEKDFFNILNMEYVEPWNR